MAKKNLLMQKNLKQSTQDTEKPRSKTAGMSGRISVAKLTQKESIYETPDINKSIYETPDMNKSVGFQS